MRAHLAALGCADVTAYIGWCKAHGFDQSVKKSWDLRQQERSVIARQRQRQRVRARVARSPEHVFLAACRGEISLDAVAHDRARALLQTLAPILDRPDTRAALLPLLEAVHRRAGFLFDEVPGVHALCTYVWSLAHLAERRAQWIRPLDGWVVRSHNRKRQFASLVHHLLARYEVPAFFNRAWFGSEWPRRRDWFVHVAKGGSIRRATLPVTLTKRQAHLFLQTPADMMIVHGFRYAQIVALGGDLRLVRAVCDTALGQTFAHDVFWQSVFRFFIEQDNLDLGRVRPLVEFLHAMKFGPDAPQPGLSMHGRSMDSLWTQHQLWQREREKAWRGPERWAASRWAGFALSAGEAPHHRTWRIKELTTRRELIVEGRKMHHCVATYAEHCGTGKSSIWSMEVEKYGHAERRQTIEVDRDGVVKQCLGKFNEDPSEEERAILHRWAQAAGLRVGRLA